MKSYRITSFCVAVLACVPAYAATYVSNLSESNIMNFTADGTHWAHASSFTTGGAYYRLDSVTLAVHANGSGTSELRLYTDNTGLPGSLIASLGSQTISWTTLAVYPAVATFLTPNTTYWLTLGESGSGDFAWRGTMSAAQSSPAGWTIGDQDLYRSIASPTWLQVNAGMPNESGLFAVDATLVPEPAALSITLLTAGQLIRRRARRIA